MAKTSDKKKRTRVSKMEKEASLEVEAGAKSAASGKMEMSAKKRKTESGKSERKKRMVDAALELGIAGKKKSDFIPLEEKDQHESEDESSGAEVGDDIINGSSKKGSKMPVLTSKDGVVYLGHIPHGFYEEQMKGFFSQFGNVKQLRLSRSKKTGKSKGYAFIQFESTEVAKIVQKAMDKYILCDRLLVCEVVKPENVHERMFHGANRKFKAINFEKASAKELNKTRTPAEKKRRLEKLKQRQKKQAEKRKAAGIKYELL